jgi:hypothetical protein
MSNSIITRFSFGTLATPLEQLEPGQRVLRAAELPPDSAQLADLVAHDPVPEVRAVAARRCADIGVLASAWQTESDGVVRNAVGAALGQLLAETGDSALSQSLLEADACSDAIRAEVARRTKEGERRRVAIAAIRDQEVLVELALAAEHAETRIAAAERVQTPDGLRRLAEGASDSDRGVARLARQRLSAIKHRMQQETESDAILAELEALATDPGPILSALVKLNRRWEALDLPVDAARLARCDAARQALQARFDREQDEQRARAQFERRLADWIAALQGGAPESPEGLAQLRVELAALREDAGQRGDEAALAKLEQAEHRIALWERERQALAAAEALVIEAEQLAAGTSIDNAGLPERWQALDRAIRTPELTRRFEAALITVERRRLAQVEVAKQETGAARQRLHSLLHAAEQALMAGQLQPVRTAADEMRALKPLAGLLPKPTTQRLQRVVQQLAELERWESFGQRGVRLQLCERAEALAAQKDPRQLALEVQKLRNEWKTLDQQQPGVPRSLWQRFDSACEKAYAPAARYFAELSARKKEARQRRETFIAAADMHARTLPGDTADWRAIERWLRDTDQAWSQGDLGSVDPGMWKRLDKQLKETLAPVRDAFSAAREQAKAGRRQLIDEAASLAARAMERDAPSQVKAIQARWQEQAKALSLPQRDERRLWEEFRAACDAVFNAREAKRREQGDRKQQGRRALEELCGQLEKLAHSTEPAPEVRRSVRELQEQWNRSAGALDRSMRDVESRFQKAKGAVEAMLSGRARSRETAVWQTLASKERMCEELDGLVVSGSTEAEARSSAAQEQWQALPALPAEWEKKMVQRRDAALRALTEPGARGEYLGRIEKAAGARREALVELELLLGMDTPAEFRAQRMAVQMKQLKQRFDRSATADAGGAGERLVACCAQPGIADALDRQRCERIFARVATVAGRKSADQR